MCMRSDLGDPEGMEMRYLVVDDNECFLSGICHLLERDGATVVGTASNGDEALVRARTCRPDVVLIDVRLGHESGFDVARRIDALAPDGGRRPAIVMISTLAEEELADRIAAHPSFGFLDKTIFSSDRLRRVLTARWAY